MELDFNSLMPGAVLAHRYELLDFLGSGAYGSVYKAYDRILETLCCVKILSPEASENEESRERFRREILLARRIAHRNCCQIFDLGVSGELYYILMEYVDGRDVLSLLKQKQTIGARDTLSIAYQVCSALRAAHEANVIHRDLKPQNIMVTRTGVAKIMDFGIAKGSDLSAMTRVGMAVGTPSYMSPEQCKGLDADPRSDIYSLGVVLFYMLTGTQPFRADSIPALIYMHISDPPPVPSSIQPAIPADVDALVLRCMAKNPADRYPSAIELRRAISQLSQKLGTNPKIRQPPQGEKPAPALKRENKDGSDGAALFLEQVIQTFSGPAPTPAPKSAASTFPRSPAAIVPPPAASLPDTEEMDAVDDEAEEAEEPLEEDLQEITAMIAGADSQATAARLAADSASTDKIPTLQKPEPPKPAKPAKSSPPEPSRPIKPPAAAAPEASRPSKPPAAAPPRPSAPSQKSPAPVSSKPPGTGRRPAPSLTLGQPTDELVKVSLPRKSGFGFGKMALYTGISLVGGVLLSLGFLAWLGLLNLRSLELVRRLAGLLRAAGTP